MTVTHTFYAFLFTVTLLGFGCNAGFLPPVSGISYEWIDPFTARLSWTWERPESLPPGCDVRYELYWTDKDVPGQTDSVRIKNRYYDNTYLTGETGSGQWEVIIGVVGDKSCDGWRSPKQRRTVVTKKPKGQLVTDFKCMMEPSGMNCSWIPLDPHLNTTMSYRLCENTEENLQSLKRCGRGYSDGRRSGCYLNFLSTDLCVVTETDSELKTFMPALVVPVPKMSITQAGRRLNLTWTTPDVGVNCGWNYQLCYKECGLTLPCQTVYLPTEPTEECPLQIDYSDWCLYEFVFSVKSSRYCPTIVSDSSGFMTHGVNKTPVQPMLSSIVTATVLSVLMAICLVVTCYCFRRHQAIFCPNIPDPSALLKDMMVSGNKDIKSATSHLYTPTPEAIEPCKLTLLTENNTPQGNS